MWNEDEVMELEFVLEEHTCCYNREETAEVIRRAYEKIWDEGFFDGRRQDAEGDDGPRFVNPYRKEN